jgi:hypothetical protein
VAIAWWAAFGLPSAAFWQHAIGEGIRQRHIIRRSITAMSFDVGSGSSSRHQPRAAKESDSRENMRV